MPKASESITPGTTPPRNMRPTEALVRPPITTMMMLGGMIGPTQEAAAVTAAPKAAP